LKFNLSTKKNNEEFTRTNVYTFLSLDSSSLVSYVNLRDEGILNFIFIEKRREMATVNTDGKKYQYGDDKLGGTFESLKSI